MLEDLVKKSKSDFFFYKGALYSMRPPETLFGFTYHSHMIPPYKPDHTLILGYGYGTVAGLIRKVWGSDLKITGVDVEKRDLDFIEYKIITIDAVDYVKQCTDSIIKKRFDYICVDLWNGKEVCDFIFNVDFAVSLREMAKGMICLNIPECDFRKMRSYYEYGFSFERFDEIEGQNVSWWSVINKGGS